MNSELKQVEKIEESTRKNKKDLYVLKTMIKVQKRSCGFSGTGENLRNSEVSGHKEKEERQNYAICRIAI